MSTPELLPYLLKVNGALVLFCAVYYLGLRRLTFFRLNRAFLLFALLFAPAYPLLDFSGWLARTAPRPAELLRLPADWPALALPPATAAPAATNWLLVAYSAGVAVFGLRLLVQLLAVRRLHRRSRPQRLHGQPFRSLPGPVMPFAFWQTVYLNPARHPAAELPTILAHEHAHVRLWHTLDILLAQLSLVFYWFNPGGWLLRRALHENLEFQADNRVLRARPHDARAYQYSLLHQSLGRGPANEIVCHFNFHLLKTRIAMMNQPRSARRLATRYLLLLPLAGALALGSCEKAIQPESIQSKSKPTLTQAQAASISEQAFHFVDGAPVTYIEYKAVGSKNIASIDILKGKNYRPGFDEGAFEQDFGAVGERWIFLTHTKAPRDPAVLATFNKRYNVAYNKPEPTDMALMQKVVDSQGLTKEELQGRLLMVNDQEAEPEKSKVVHGQLRSVFAMSPEQAERKYGAKGSKGAILIRTK